ncbi:DUF3099 domain-containing protein [Actinocorallia populi]|uniref:DUF3099 domain-containing protein n=1 Tax=Actinocorallia populi TaxID=2079200 RepID=UPI0013003393|nr:DUF3099 domain-containing protein [Actinocorallia populi]
MRALSRRKTTVYTVTDASRPLSEDVDERQRHYLISMGVRMACLVLAVVLWGRVHPVLLGLLLVGAILLPYTAVVFANGGRKPPPGGGPAELFEGRAISAPPPPPQAFRRDSPAADPADSSVPSETSP